MLFSSWLSLRISPFSCYFVWVPTLTWALAITSCFACAPQLKSCLSLSLSLGAKWEPMTLLCNRWDSTKLRRRGENRETRKPVIKEDDLTIRLQTESHLILTRIEVESIVNARFLTYVCDDTDGISFVLAPSHLINGLRLQGTSNASHFEVVSTHESLTRRSRHQKQLLH